METSHTCRRSPILLSFSLPSSPSAWKVFPPGCGKRWQRNRTRSKAKNHFPSLACCSRLCIRGEMLRLVLEHRLKAKKAPFPKTPTESKREPSIFPSLPRRNSFFLPFSNSPAINSNGSKFGNRRPRHHHLLPPPHAPWPLLLCITYHQRPLITIPPPRPTQKKGGDCGGGKTLPRAKEEGEEIY